MPKKILEYFMVIMVFLALQFQIVSCNNDNFVKNEFLHLKTELKYDYFELVDKMEQYLIENNHLDSKDVISCVILNENQEL